MVLIIGLQQEILLDKKGRIMDLVHRDSIFRRKREGDSKGWGGGVTKELGLKWSVLNVPEAKEEGILIGIIRLFCQMQCYAQPNEDQDQTSGFSKMVFM